MSDFDAVGLGILWDRLISITNEIALTLVRTSFSSIVRAYDLACVLFDGDGRSLAQATYSVPVFIGTAPQTMRHMLAAFPAETLRPGDVIVTNSIYMGTGHLWDICIMRPAFKNGQLVGFAMSISHLPDVGGRGMSAVNADHFEEGLQIPIMKLAREGEPNTELLDLIRQNVRVPEQVLGDIMANVSAVEVGCRELVSFMDEYGIDDLRNASAAIIAQSERAMRRQIAAVPDGVYRNRIRVEAFDQPVTLACAVEIAGDRLHVDFDGTGPCLPVSINVPLCYTRAMTCFAIKCLILPNVPNNEGSVNPVELSAPEGSILNCQPPAATGARFMVGHFIAPLIFGAMAEALPGRVQGDPGMMNIVNVQGQRRDGEPFTTLFFSAGGFGALDGLDGTNATPAPSNMTVVPTELWEQETNTRILRRELRPDSGGPGEFRGGLGQTIEFVNDSGHTFTMFAMGPRTQFPPLGMHGGGAGAMRVYRRNGEVVDAQGRHDLQPGDVLTIEDSGGGGFGPPGNRRREQLLRDLAENLVTPDGARRDYGFEAGETD